MERRDKGEIEERRKGRVNVRERNEKEKERKWIERERERRKKKMKKDIDWMGKLGERPNERIEGPAWTTGRKIG